MGPVDVNGDGGMQMGPIWGSRGGHSFELAALLAGASGMYRTPFLGCLPDGRLSA
jgi:hypothetical protein